jgi:hypothetical protein
MSRSRSVKATSIAGALFVLLAHASLAVAAPRATITIETTRQGPAGTFEASGAFADAGSFAVQGPVFGGPGPGAFVNVHATETFTGADGAFTIVRNVRVTWGDDPTTRTITGTWAVISGTGAYEDLHAAGTLSGTVAGFPPAEIFVVTYTGSAEGG